MEKETFLKKNLSVIIIVGVLVLVVLVGLSRDKKSDQSSIVIGGAFTLTGDAATWGEVDRNGAQLAIDEINAKGGIDGRKVILAVEDTRSTSKDAVSAMNKLTSTVNPDAYLISWLDVYQGAENVLPPGRIMISPDAGAEAVNGGKAHPGIYITWYRTKPKSELSVQFLAQKGVKKLYIVTENDSYYTGVINFMKEAAQKNGIEIVAEQTNTNADMNSVLTKISAAQPDAVFFGFYDQKKISDFLSKYRNFLKKDTVVFGDEIVQQNYASSQYPKGIFEGVYFYSPQEPSSSFLSAYREKYNSEPVFGAAPAYDSVYMIAKVLSDNPTDIDAYMHSKKFDTVSYGSVTFDEINAISTPINYFTIKQVQNGQPVIVSK